MPDAIESIKRSTTADRIFEILHTWIVSGQLKPGDVLPPQDTLAKRLEVSRNTLREAIFKLTALGLVRSKQGLGTVVQPSNPGNYLGSLQDHLTLDNITLREFIEARLITECAIVRLVVERAGQEELARLNAILASQDVAFAAGDHTEFNRQDMAFHMELGQACGNSVMRKVFETIWELLNQFAAKSHRVPGNVELALEGHRRILGAVQRRDAAAAEQELTAHIRVIARRTVNHLGLELDLAPG